MRCLFLPPVIIRAPFAYNHAHNEAEENYREYEEKQESRNLRCTHGDTAKSEDPGDDGDYEKTNTGYSSVVKHDGLLFQGMIRLSLRFQYGGTDTWIGTSWKYAPVLCHVSSVLIGKIYAKTPADSVRQRT